MLLYHLKSLMDKKNLSWLMKICLILYHPTQALMDIRDIIYFLWTNFLQVSLIPKYSRIRWVVKISRCIQKLVWTYMNTKKIEILLINVDAFSIKFGSMRGRKRERILWREPFWIRKKKKKTLNFGSWNFYLNFLMWFTVNVIHVHLKLR